MKDKIINITAGTLGDAASVAVEGMTFPGAGTLGLLIGPVVATISEDFIHRKLSRLENDRLKSVGDNVEAKIQARLEAGDQPRRDDDFYVNDEYGQSSASKLLEEMLLKCKQEYEAKKLKSYSNFWCNICFENGVSYESANSILGLFSTLSYQQVKLLIYLNAGYTVPLNRWEKYMFTSEVLEPYYTLYSDFLQLFSVRLARSKGNANRAIQVGTPEICISPSGKLMCKLLELQLAQEEMAELFTYIKDIDNIVNRLMTTANDNGEGNVIHSMTDDDVNEIFERF